MLSVFIFRIKILPAFFRREIFLLYFIFKMMSPVSVSTSHVPPVVLLGTSIFPVSVSAKKILSVRSVPVTLPVSVSTLSCAASQRSNFMLPVLLSIEILSDAITFLRVMLPVVPSELKL